jgi:hypothetical protein
MSEMRGFVNTVLRVGGCDQDQHGLILPLHGGESGPNESGSLVSGGFIIFIVGGQPPPHFFLAAQNMGFDGAQRAVQNLRRFFVRQAVLAAEDDRRAFVWIYM